MRLVSHRTVARLSLYRRLLDGLRAGGVQNVYSHRLAELAGATAAQVRRDLMVVGYTGSPSKGYDVAQLAGSIGAFLDPSQPQGIALVGVGNLGRAILAYFAGRRPKLAITACFDADPAKVGRFIHGCPCHGMDELAGVVGAQGVQTAIIAVPAAEAQAVAEALVRAGVQGLVNFAPARLHVPPHVFVEDMDITMVLEKVAYFARRGRAAKEDSP